MKAITVRGIDESLDRVLRQTADQEAKSVNQLVLEILKAHFGQGKVAHFTRRHHDLDDLFGSWSDDDFEKVMQSVESQHQIDPDVWT